MKIGKWIFFLAMVSSVLAKDVKIFEVKDFRRRDWIASEKSDAQEIGGSSLAYVA